AEPQAEVEVPYGVLEGNEAQKEPTAAEWSRDAAGVVMVVDAAKANPCADADVDALVRVGWRKHVLFDAVDGWRGRLGRRALLLRWPPLRGLGRPRFGGGRRGVRLLLQLK